MDQRFKEPYSNPRWWYGGDLLPACFGCKHFRGMVKGKISCTAFLGGIPQEIICSEEIIHRAPYPGDGGIQFEDYIEKGT